MTNKATDELLPCPFCGHSAYTDTATAIIMGERTCYEYAIACCNWMAHVVI